MEEKECLSFPVDLLQAPRKYTGAIQSENHLVKENIFRHQVFLLCLAFCLFIDPRKERMKESGAQIFLF